MKKLTTLILFSAIALSSSAQVFWTEDFGTGCNTGTNANAFVTANGQWNVTDVAVPEAYANQWFISGHTRNTGVGNCANLCAVANNPTLHIGNSAIPLFGLGADSTSYLTGFYCSFGYCNTTHKRAESPNIDCTGKTGITFSCIYFEGGDVPGGLNGDCSLWYFDGATWTMLDPLAKTNQGSPCNGTFGTWTSYSISLPASADNNPNVKLGFQWDNNDVSAGTDPSTAFDDLQLSSGSASAPVAGFTADVTTGCDSVCVTFTDTSLGATSRTWSFPGGSPSTSSSATQVVCYNAPGSYDVTLVSVNGAGSDTVTQGAYITVAQTPVPNFSVNDQNICANDCLTFTDLTTGTVQVYTWTFAGAFPLNSNQQNPAFICYQTPGDFSVTLTVENGTCTNSITFVDYINVNQAAEPIVTVLGDTLISTPALTYQWYEIQSGAIPAAIFQSYIVPGDGQYYVCIQDAFGCSSCSDTILMTNDITEINQPAFSVYPNPVKDVLKISVTSATITGITILDVMGKTIFEAEPKISASTKSVDVAPLAKGVYWIEAKSSSGKFYRSRFLKE